MAVIDYIYNSETYASTKWAKAQLIDDNYFRECVYPHSINVTWKVKTYTWDYTQLGSSKNDIEFYADLSSKIVSVDYTCDMSNNVKISATLTLHTPIGDNFWYMRKEGEIKQVPSSEDAGTYPSIWRPQIYHIIQEFEFPNDNPYYYGFDTNDDDVNWFNSEDGVRLSSTIAERDLGYFLPVSSGYVFDSTTNQTKIELQGLACALTSEMGGIPVTVSRSFDYFYNMPYNNNPTKILRYQNSDNTPSSGFKPESTSTIMETVVPKTDIEKEYEQFKMMESQYRNSIPQSVFTYGVVSGTAANKVVPETTTVSNDKISAKTITTPLPLSFSGTHDGKTNGLPMYYSGTNLLQLIYNLAVGRTDAVLNKYHIPLNGIGWISIDTEDTAKNVYFPSGFDFENGMSVMEIAENVFSQKYHEPMLWVDEQRRLCVDSYPTVYTTERDYIPYRAYSGLVIDEDISYDDQNMFTVTEVYGKDSEYYGVYDGTFDGFKGALGVSAEQILGNMVSQVFAEESKTQVITDESLESDKECYDRAVYETWKSTRNHEQITIKVRDNYIFNLNSISQIVGKTFIEYKTLKGETMLCVPISMSLSDGVWTWQLRPFHSYAPSYDWYDTNIFQVFRTKHFHSWIQTKYNSDCLELQNNSEYITHKEKNTLSQPVIDRWEIVDNKLRLYITGADIGVSVVKIWKQSDNGASNFSDFVGETVNTGDTYNASWGDTKLYKIFDYPITQNGEYNFVAQLYSPFHEPSLCSEPVYINVTDYGVETGHRPYLIIPIHTILTDENGNRLTI